MRKCEIEIRIALLTTQPDCIGQKPRVATFNVYEWKQSINFMSIVSLELYFPNTCTLSCEKSIMGTTKINKCCFS